MKRKWVSARIRANRAWAMGIRVNGGIYLELFDRKHLLTGFLRGAGFPVVRDLALIGEGGAQLLEPNPHGRPISLERYLGELPNGRYFLKPVSGEHGRNAGCLELDDGNARFNGSNVELASILALAAGTRPAAGGSAAGRLMLLQAWVRQHVALADYCANTLNTLRVLSLEGRDGTVQAVHAVLRFGREAAWLDNFHAGGVAINVDLQTGKTARFAVRLDQAATYAEHPDSGKPFSCFPVPFFKDAIALVTQAHALFPGLRSAGWDVAISPDGPLIIEGNLAWDAEIHAFADSDFRARIASLLRES